MSRPHLIKLLEENRIPYHRTGSHRRILLKDLVAYAKRRDSERNQILNTLAREAFADGLYEGGPVPEGGEDE